jgi:hypothetical protein
VIPDIAAVSPACSMRGHPGSELRDDEQTHQLTHEPARFQRIGGKQQAQLQSTQKTTGSLQLEGASGMRKRDDRQTKRIKEKARCERRSEDCEES